MRETTYETIVDRDSLVKVPAWSDRDELVICIDRVVLHHETQQMDGRYGVEEVHFSHVTEVARDRSYLRLYTSTDSGISLWVSFDKARIAQWAEGAIKAGIGAYHGDATALRNFRQRIARLQEAFGEDTTVHVRVVVPPSIDHERHAASSWGTMVLDTPEAGERLIETLRSNPTLHHKQLPKVPQLPLMLEARWNLAPGEGFLEVGYTLDEGDGHWYHCPNDGFHVGHYAYDEERLRRDVAEAVEHGRTVYLSDCRTHPNIRFLAGGVVKR